MKNRGMKIKHPKLRGEWAELRFMTRAAEHGLCVTKPWGETARYDLVIRARCGAAGVRMRAIRLIFWRLI